MSSTKDIAASQTAWNAEQLFYFSFPGQVFLLLLAIWAFLGGKLVVSTDAVAAAVVASVPLGFLIYQAYSSGAFWVYHIVWYGRKSENQIKLVMKILDPEGKLDADSDELYRRAKRSITFLNNSDPQGAYLWRLIGFVNSRGACLLAVVLASLVPPVIHIMTPFSTRLSDLNLELTPVDNLLFSAFCSATALALWWGIPKVRNQLKDYADILVATRAEELRKLASQHAGAYQDTMRTG